MSRSREQSEAVSVAVQAFTGKLMKGAEEGSVRGWLYDHKTGLRIEFSGAKDPRPQGSRGGGYLLVGRRVPV